MPKSNCEFSPSKDLEACHALLQNYVNTADSLCEPPAKNIVEPLTLMALRGKVFISHAFISPVRFCEPVFGSQVLVKPREKRKERNQYISHIEIVKFF